jgi:hypothetical protein
MALFHPPILVYSAVGKEFQIFPKLTPWQCTSQLLDALELLEALRSSGSA